MRRGRMHELLVSWNGPTEKSDRELGEDLAHGKFLL